MRTAKVFSQKVNGWQLLADALSEELASKPHLQPLHTELVDAIADARQMLADQETARAQLLDSVQLRRGIEARGDGIRSRLSSFLRGELGPRNLQLVRYGVPPLVRSRRQPQTEEPPPPELTAPDDASGNAGDSGASG
jgi:hypothetical protein